MTTIAWDGRTLASDRQSTWGSRIDCGMRKIARNAKGDLCGASGCAVTMATFLRWFEDGEPADARPSMKHGDDETFALIVRAGGALEFHSARGWAPILDAPFYAFGSGAQCARGALAAGKKAAEAIEIASRFDTETGGGVDTLILHSLEERTPSHRFAANPPPTDGTIVDAYDATNDQRFLARFVQGLWYECNPVGVPITPRTFFEWRAHTSEAA